MLSTQNNTLKIFWKAILNTNNFSVIKLAEDLMNNGANAEGSFKAMMEVESEETDALFLEESPNNEKVLYSFDKEDLPF